ncbi:hypothetical protein [Roseovarius sp. M141]|uniref:hypothetical protein n=1 Tax=Roseovarius sp. M141 TaxID=2583806 RepID=UPI0020CDAD8C|nr:hypothetical protein [Roseovarius sp. M141]MCQ0091939.1 hypothetical protein [Roseovarius sp. M141]
MIKLTPAVTAIALACAAPLAAAAQDNLPTHGDTISEFRTAGAWNIRKNETRENCFASYESDSGAIVQFGFAEGETAGYLGLFSPNATDVPATQEIAILANGNLYVGEATGMGPSVTDGYSGGYILVNNPEFAKDIEMGQELVAFPETPNSYIIDMRGAKNAVYEVRKCTTELQSK